MLQTSDNLDGGELNNTLETPGANQSKDELTDILSPHFNLETMVRESGLPNMNSKDVEEIFKGVLTDENQESQQGYTGLISFPVMGEHFNFNLMQLINFLI